ncbi:MAG TPA: hypothetical protein VFM05_15225 [Candidatus Saccharimonadales bacterium]|nr:hypothetical protein [Candidatus Saccharimonadales bacterium]
MKRVLLFFAGIRRALALTIVLVVPRIMFEKGIVVIRIRDARQNIVQGNVFKVFALQRQS